MARFYGELHGARGPASRCGTPASGLRSHARGWHLGAEAELRASGNYDRLELRITGGSNNPRELLSFGTWERELSGELRPADARARAIAELLRRLELRSELRNYAQGTTAEWPLDDTCENEK